MSRYWRIFAAAGVLALAACETTGDLDMTEGEGTLVGAGTGALAGAAASGGVIVPAAGAVGGAVIGEELAEDDPIFD